MNLKILYRGPLSSCNYGCAYCPFAKHKESARELDRDRSELADFLAWVEHSSRPLSVLFTPWGEGLVRAWYRDALIKLTGMAHVEVAAIQTNLSAPLAFVESCVPEHLGIWATYHPEWADRARFVARATRLHEMGVRISVGIVGLRRFRAEIQTLRAELPQDLYLWVNAAKSYEDYHAEDMAFFEQIDPWFAFNSRQHPSGGRACQAGLSAISVDGGGTVRRCHFIDTPLGNLYTDDLDEMLRPRTCTNDTCGCHIGYVHLDYLELDKVFGSGILERVPMHYPSAVDSPSVVPFPGFANRRP